MAGAAQAEYPERAINMVVPAAGGPTDNVARSLAEAMRPTLGQTVVVENKGGRRHHRHHPGGARPARRLLGAADARGLLDRSPLYKNPGYDPYKSFEPIGLGSMCR